jgi:general secretion pathway protein A
VNPALSPAESISITPAEAKSVVRRPGGNTFSTRRQAYVAIFTRWGAQFSSAPGNQIPCDFAPSAGLQCLSQRGTWSDIEQVNLPVVLELWDDQPTPFYAALTSIQDDTLTLTLGKEQLDVEQRDLRDSWYGSYVVLWQTPPGYRGSIRQGDSHETVSWLRQQIGADSSASPSTANPDFFDANLHSAVVEFQRREGLVMDGVVGPATWIRLASQLQLPAPNLRT